MAQSFVTLRMTVTVAFLGLAGCVTAPPVADLALLDATLRYVRQHGVQEKQPISFHQATLLAQQAEDLYQKQEFAKARTFARRALELIEQAEFAVILAEGKLEKEESASP